MSDIDKFISATTARRSSMLRQTTKENPMSKILNQSQAKAVYDAVCALNNVSACSGIELSFVASREGADYFRATYAENAAGEVVVFSGPSMVRNVPRENYPNQAAFAAAYNLEN
jgi:hypothetical protein